MTTPDRFFTYKKADAEQFRLRNYGAPGARIGAIDLVWDVCREGWWLGQVARRPYGYGAGHTWQAYFGGWKSWPERRRIDAADALWMARAETPWIKGPGPQDVGP
jgi:hypothetical protein